MTLLQKFDTTFFLRHNVHSCAHL